MEANLRYFKQQLLGYHLLAAYNLGCQHTRDAFSKTIRPLADLAKELQELQDKAIKELSE